jgi:molybdopterin molybdotransferase
MTVIARLDELGCGCDAALGLASIDQALERLRALPRRTGRIDEVALADALGRVLARPVTARANVPPFTSSAMDGYALCTRDLIGDGPWELPVTARIAAGDIGTEPLEPGSAARIFTGGALPAGADAVVMQEAVTAKPGGITLDALPRPGQHLRQIGDDMGANDVILPAGRRLGARDIAACAASGRASVSVQPVLRVALLMTGTEIVAQDQDLLPGQIWDVNGPMITALLQRPSSRIIATARAEDDANALQAQLQDLATRADLIVTSGGISVGDTDLVKPTLLALGGTIDLSGVAIKPGKPISFGRLGGAIWLGLPGNPVSAYVTWQIFGTALLNHLSGRTAPPARRHVVLSEPLSHHPGRCELRPATLTGHDAMGREIVRFDTRTHSARVGTLCRADGLILIPAEADQLQAGDLIEFLPFETE